MSKQLVASLAAGLIGGMLGSMILAPSHAADRSVYRAERFELVRPDGRVGAVLGYQDPNSSDPRAYLAL